MVISHETAPVALLLFGLLTLLLFTLLLLFFPFYWKKVFVHSHLNLDILSFILVFLFESVSVVKFRVYNLLVATVDHSLMRPL